MNNITRPDIIEPLASVTHIPFIISSVERNITPRFADKNTSTLVIIDFAEDCVAVCIAVFLSRPFLSSSWNLVVRSIE